MSLKTVVGALVALGGVVLAGLAFHYHVEVTWPLVGLICAVCIFGGLLMDYADFKALLDKLPLPKRPE